MIDGRWVCGVCGHGVRYRWVEGHVLRPGRAIARRERVPHACSNFDCPNHTPPRASGWARRADLRRGEDPGQATAS